MRIAVVSDCYLPRLGGIEVQVHDLCARLAAGGHEVEVFTATHDGPRQHVREVDPATGVVVHRLPLPVPGAPPINPFVSGEMRAHFAEGSFDVVHAHLGVVSPFATEVAGLAVSMRMPLAATWHCVLGRQAAWMRARGQVRRWAEAGAALSAVSSMAAHQVSSVAGDARVAVVGNGIDVEQWRRPGHVEPALGPTVGRTVRVVSALRFVTRKRPWALLSVLEAAGERVRRDHPEVRLEVCLVGEGPQRALMRQVIRRRGDLAEWIDLPGRVSRDELRNLLWHSDIYLTTARLEAFGIAALEARTAGLAVACRSGTGADDFIADGVNGVVAASDTELAERLAELAGDADQLARITGHNRSTPPTQSWEQIVTATLAEYARAV